ncbi:hypothetical protein SAMN05421676_105126 [Salinibacillus kushneri]|uniref:YesK-like protein n=1 Tax=Salinibacillus kushneri TaxID=237682 RepID=A0A1I0EYA4_9BACI|nr:hypothetical protein [Salinibacillus kushneri]SET50493.1 hypothetical protein SAMN05421676_105126 [Salinibacillus kushneri]
MTYLILFLSGLSLGLILQRIEWNSKKLKKWIRTALNLFFLVSIILVAVGYGLLVNMYVVNTGLYIFIPTFAVYLVRQTFIYFKVKE